MRQTRLCALLLYFGVPFLVAAWPAHSQSTDQFGRGHELIGSGYTVVDFAASWCDPCYKALPRLQQLAGEHPGVRFLVVSVDEEPAGRDRLVEDLGLGLPVIWDENHRLVEMFHPIGFPATYLLNPSGEVVYEHTGYTKKKWRSFVEALTRLDNLPASQPEVRAGAEPASALEPG